MIIENNNHNEAHVIMNDEIENIELVHQETNPTADRDQLFNSLFQVVSIEQPNENLDEKRKNLVDWLIKNRIPIKCSDDNLINIMDSVFIHSPYNIENCESTNEIILNKVINLIKQLKES